VCKVTQPGKGGAAPGMGRFHWLFSAVLTLYTSLIFQRSVEARLVNGSQSSTPKVLSQSCMGQVLNIRAQRSGFATVHKCENCVFPAFPDSQHFPDIKPYKVVMKTLTSVLCMAFASLHCP